MSREEQIEKIINDDWNHLEGDCPDVAFRKGIEWADSHPNWHKTKINDNQYDLPDKSGQYLIVHTECPNDVMEGKFLRNSNVWFVENCYCLNYEIIAWMENPQPPKFD